MNKKQKIGLGFMLFFFAFSLQPFATTCKTKNNADWYLAKKCDNISLFYRWIKIENGNETREMKTEFIGILPFPGFQMFISASLAAVLKYNKTAAVAGIFNTNLVTGAFVFAFNYWLGKKILGIESTFQMPERVNLSFAKTVIEAGGEVFFSLLLGGFITGILAMFLGYYISLSILTKNQKTNGN